MRLVFHWTVKITFFGDVQLYMKGIIPRKQTNSLLNFCFLGTRDPHHLYDAGSGFVLCWQGNPEIRVGYENQQKELIQVLSDDMLIAVPK
jgi:hypothetical protein